MFDSKGVRKHLTYWTQSLLAGYTVTLMGSDDYAHMLSSMESED